MLALRVGQRAKERFPLDWFKRLPVALATSAFIPHSAL